MAGKQYKVVAIDDGYLVVDAPLSEFKDKGFFTMYDQTAMPKGTADPGWSCSTWHSVPRLSGARGG